MKAHKFKHLIFFDSSCPLCRASVKKIIQIDKKNLFCFAPLTGETAEFLLKDEHQKFLKENTLVLLENFSKGKKKYSLRAKGFFRTLWLIGGIYKIFGIFYILPAFSIDWIYRIIAKHRHKVLKKQDKVLFELKEKKRLLP